MRSSIRIILISFVAMSLFASCKRTGPARLHAIYIVDLTASTLEDARAKAFAGIKEPFDKGLLKRGDSVAVIPITSDALIESQGSILRFDLPTDREVYDQDLQDLSDRVISELTKMQKNAEANPYPYSDILGAIRIAGEEFSTDKPGTRRLLVVLSDCVQDVKQMSFKTAAIVANKNNASKTAKEMATADGKIFASANVYIGLLRSTDLKSMSPQRREGVETFWVEYFQQTGAKSVHVSSDGPGQLAKFISD